MLSIVMNLLFSVTQYDLLSSFECEQNRLGFHKDKNTIFVAISAAISNVRLWHFHYYLGWCLGLWCLTPLSAILKLFRGGQFYSWGKSWVPGENHRAVASHWQIYHIMMYWVHLAMNGIRTHKFSGDTHWLHG